MLLRSPKTARPFGLMVSIVPNERWRLPGAPRTGTVADAGRVGTRPASVPEPFQDADADQAVTGRILSQVVYGVVFAITGSDLPDGTLGVRAAAITSLLMLGVPVTRAIALAAISPDPQHSSGAADRSSPDAVVLHIVIATMPSGLQPRVPAARPGSLSLRGRKPW